MAQLLIHGTLHVSILESSSLLLEEKTCTDVTSKPSSFRKTPSVSVKRFMKRRFSWIRNGSALLCRPKASNSFLDSNSAVNNRRIYATIDLEKARVGRTRVVDNSDGNPRWFESFHIYCAHTASSIVFTVKIDNRPVGGASVVGRAHLPVEDILTKGDVDQWVRVVDRNGNQVGRGAVIHVKVRFFDVSRDPNGSWGKGIASPNFPGVPFTFFSQRKGCKVTLYQDAHVLDGLMPKKIPLSGGRTYQPRKCWEEIFDAINDARHFIYVTGWSVYTSITLVRRWPEVAGLVDRRYDVTLGDLLKRKANEGVRVLMLVWDDRTSVGLLKKDGLMATHDEDTFRFFQDTAVTCVLCPRNPDDGGTLVQDLEISTMFTHHQKTVVVDAGMPKDRFSRKRRIVGFVGGIDLCDGRYDAQSHSLFKTLNSVHRDDFHQPNFPEASLKKGGPREPWHDIHCKVEGPVAWDVLFNFEQRWRKQGEGENERLLLDLISSPDIFIPPSPATFANDRDTWNVQLFRSIDGGAAFGFPTTPDEAARAGLVSGKDHTIDRSIQDAYIHAIRRAKNFIYIENQYFVGSSFGWMTNDDVKVEDVGASHLIPKELSLKIVSKIEANEEFRVYIVVPMWPEGVPESASVQAILDWQRRTMEMMYMDISLALRGKGITVNSGFDLRDYLSFFCLGNREKPSPPLSSPAQREASEEEIPDPDSDYGRAQKARRFMIYVHAKLMIVDDEYIIIGSANINQRSMDGGRDTEIAIGAYQPHQLGLKGEIYGFRMSLWYEHLGLLDNRWVNPQTLDCMREVNRIGDMYWNMYASEEQLPDRDLPGHLLTYPIEINRGNGEINSGVSAETTGKFFFPDTKASVRGKKSEFLPPILTT